MKRTIQLALSLLLVLPVFASSVTDVASTPSPVRKLDSMYYAFAYDAVPQGNNVYTVTIYFLLVDHTTYTYSYVSAPANISITGNFGSGTTTFTFPGGSGSLNVGNFTYSSAPTQAFPITTNPTSVSGLPISQILADINIP